MTNPDFSKWSMSPEEYPISPRRGMRRFCWTYCARASPSPGRRADPYALLELEPAAPPPAEAAPAWARGWGPAPSSSSESESPGAGASLPWTARLKSRASRRSSSSSPSAAEADAAGLRSPSVASGSNVTLFGAGISSSSGGRAGPSSPPPRDFLFFLLSREEPELELESEPEEDDELLLLLGDLLRRLRRSDDERPPRRLRDERRRLLSSELELEDELELPLELPLEDDELDDDDADRPRLLFLRPPSSLSVLPFLPLFPSILPSFPPPEVRGLTSLPNSSTTSPSSGSSFGISQTRKDGGSPPPCRLRISDTLVLHAPSTARLSTPSCSTRRRRRSSARWARAWGPMRRPPGPDGGPPPPEP
mmetsp:Transcript_31358/g.70994  ORF Transcript_31358/g.70994 Transcript_31358/m.70994 type:complete len:364 (+) Transcript_31358:190-1281(+)